MMHYPIIVGLLIIQPWLPIFCLVPPKFQWSLIDYDWEGNARDVALRQRVWIPENNMPAGIAKWRDKLFITVPRWKRGVPSSLNYIHVDGNQNQLLKPYPSWSDAYVSDTASSIPSNSTVVSTFRVAVDKCDRLWVIDTGVADIFALGNQVSPPALVIFDLKSDKLLKRYVLKDGDIKGPETFFTNILVDIVGEDCQQAYAYIADMGANTLLVYSLAEDTAWRVDHPYFHFDPHSGEFRVGGIQFYWSDGITALTLSAQNKDGYRDLYFHPLASTRLFKMSTKLLRNKDVEVEDMFNGVDVVEYVYLGQTFQVGKLNLDKEVNRRIQLQHGAFGKHRHTFPSQIPESLKTNVFNQYQYPIVGNRGPRTQSNACILDPTLNIMFYTQINKNGIACWNMDNPLSENNTQIIFSDCDILQFPSDLKIDNEGNLWMLSNKMPKFLYSQLDKSDVNFRILVSPISSLIKGTKCEPEKRKSSFVRALSFLF